MSNIFVEFHMRHASQLAAAAAAAAPAAAALGWPTALMLCDRAPAVVAAAASIYSADSLSTS